MGQGDGYMNKKSVIYQCFSGRLKEFLLSKGHDILCSGLHCGTTKKFWVFEMNNKLSHDLDEFTKLKNNSLGKC